MSEKKARIDWKWKYQMLKNAYEDDQVTILKLLKGQKHTLEQWKYTIKMWEYTLNFDIVSTIAFFIGGLLLGLIIAS